ncbi:MAG: hypothetical protein RLZZ175_233 [Bacteroidota bacterium]|jgi:hypothetical protein
MKKAFVILLLLLTKSISLFAQTNYDIKVLGALNNKIEFDTSLNWYAIEIKNEEKSLYSKQRFIKLDVDKDIKVKYCKHQYSIKNKSNKDSVVTEYYYHHKLASKYSNCSNFLIGSKKELTKEWANSSINYISKFYSYNLKLDDTYLLTEILWEINPTYPIIKLEVSGFSYKSYESDSNEYHLNVTYSTDKHQFIQSLDSEINSVKGFKNIISYLHLEFMGDIDNDGINDFILTDASNFRNYLFLSYKHDVKEKKIMHLEKGFINEKFDFLKDF